MKNLPMILNARHGTMFSLACGLAIAWPASADAPMGYLSTHGPAADPVTRLNWGLIAISVTVVIIITGLVLYASLRKRPPLDGSDNKAFPTRLPVVPDQGGLPWIYVGVGISSLVLLAVIIWTLKVLSAVAAPAHPALTVEIVARQWWWEARYSKQDSKQVMVTANEIHIPVGKAVQFKLVSHDVIHSFWVPKLGGKTDVIPGQDNFAWLQADKPGIYRGQCAEFCGPQHAHMAIYIIAQEQQEFDAWWQSQSRDSSLPAQPQQQIMQGKNIFIERCSMCHTVRGTTADGKLGPDLTHLMSRRTIAAGMLPNTVASLNGWVGDSQSVKPGVLMPSFKLNPQELHAVVDYLKTLQ